MERIKDAKEVTEERVREILREELDSAQPQYIKREPYGFSVFD